MCTPPSLPRNSQTPVRIGLRGCSLIMLCIEGILLVNKWFCKMKGERAWKKWWYGYVIAQKLNNSRVKLIKFRQKVFLMISGEVGGQQKWKNYFCCSNSTLWQTLIGVWLASDTSLINCWYANCQSKYLITFFWLSDIVNGLVTASIYELTTAQCIIVDPPI